MAARVLDAVSLMKYFRTTKNFDRVLEKVKIITVENGKCLAELKVDESHTNPMGGLHGGLSTTLVDVISAYALATQVPSTHVSVDINMSFMKGAVPEDEILIDASVLRKGKTLAFLEVEIKNKKSGDLLVKGSHTKYILPKRFPEM